MVALTTTEVRGKVNPFRDGPALLRSARADGWFPTLRDVMRAVLLGQFNDSAKRVRNEEEPVTDELLLEWRAKVLNAQRQLTLNMVREGFLLAKEEFSGSSLSWGYSGKQEEGEIVGDLVVTPEGEIEQLVFTRADFTKIDAHLNAIASSQTRQSATIIQGVFERSVDDGLTPRQIAKELVSKGAVSSKNRARMIARTETIWAYNRGALQNYRSIGIETKEWMVTADDRLCPWCASMDGTVTATDNPFWQAGDSLNVVKEERSLTLNFKMAVEHPPLHPNCRCVLLPILKTITVAEPPPPPIEPKLTPKISEDLLRDIDDDQLPIFEKAAKDLGTTVAELKIRVDTHLTGLFEEADTFIRVPDSALETILKDGRFKSQFETGTSRGLLDEGVRKSVEKSLLGVADDIPLNQRPIYGYASSSETGFVGLNPTTELDAYGHIAVKLKRSTRNRTSMLFDDSFNVSISTPSDFTSPSVRSLEISKADDIKKVLRQQNVDTVLDNIYTEVHIHRGVSIGDIEEIVFDKRVPSDSLKKLMQQKKIKWRVTGSEPIAETRKAERIKSKIEKVTGKGKTAEVRRRDRRRK